MSKSVFLIRMLWVLATSHLPLRSPQSPIQHFPLFSSLPLMSTLTVLGVKPEAFYYTLDPKCPTVF